MKKTLLIAQIFPPSVGGVQSYLWNICKRLPGAQLVVLTHGSGTDSEKDFDAAQPFPIERMDFFSKLNVIAPGWLGVMARAKKIINARGIEQVLCAEIIPTGTIGLFLNKPMFLFTYGRDMVLPKKSSIKQIIATRVLKKSKKIITISDFTKKLINSYGNFSEKITMLSPGVDHERFSPEKINPDLKARHKLEGKKILLSVGRLDRRKGFDTIIRLMPRILEKVPEAHYVIVGEGDDKAYLKELITQHNLAAHATLIEERVTDEELPFFYTMADAFITISRDMLQEGNVEGFGIVFIEANACGIPVVGGRSGGTEDAIADGETVFLVNPQNDEEIVEKTTLLLKDRELAKQLGKQGRERVVHNFDWDKKIRTFEQTL